MLLSAGAGSCSFLTSWATAKLKIDSKSIAFFMAFTSCGFFGFLGLRDFLKSFSPQEVPEWNSYMEFQALGWFLGFFLSIQKGQNFQVLVEVLHPPCAGVDAGLY